jgi:hypothetical protein
VCSAVGPRVVADYYGHAWLRRPATRASSGDRRP